MKKWLYLAVDWMARIHDRFLSLNDGSAVTLSDKQLHFLVIGVFGMVLFFVIHPIFKALIRHGHEMAVTWIYVFTLILVVTFGIEIGQRVSHTGTMEFADMVFGITGFLTMFAAYALLRALVLGIVRLIRRGRS